MIKFLHRHFHLRYRDVYVHAKKLFILDMGLLALALAMLVAAVIFFFWRPGLMDMININFSFGGERIRSGEPVTIVIDYKNESKYLLREAEMAVHLPPGFVVDRETTPVEIFSDQSIFSLNNIKSGGSGQLLIHGILYAEPGIDNKITAFLTYIPEEKTAKEQKISGAIIRAVDSVLTAAMTVEENTLPSQKLPWEIKIKNTGDRELTGVDLGLTWPVNPEIADTRNLTLSPGEEKIWRGELTAPDEAGEYHLNGLVNITANHQVIKQVSWDKKINVFFPELYATGEITATRGYLEPGDTLPLAISWQNRSQFALNNLKITVTPNQNIVNLAATARENNLKLAKNQLVIDASARTALANGQPGGGEEFVVQLILSPNFSAATQPDFNVALGISASVPEVPNQIFTRQSQTNSVSLSTDVSLFTEIRYYTSTGDQIGRGALPPKVGEETKYWVINKIKNTSNEIKDLYFAAKLGDGVKMAEKQSVTLGNKLTYDAAKNTVSWNWPSAPANSEIGLFFEVSVVPEAQSVGKEILLVKTVDFSATDAKVGKVFNLTAKNIFNTLPTDDRGQVKGARVEE